MELTFLAEAVLAVLAAALVVIFLAAVFAVPLVAMKTFGPLAVGVVVHCQLPFILAQAAPSSAAP